MPYFSSSGDFPNTPGSTEDIEDVVADLQQLATSLDSAHVDLMQLVAALAPYTPTTLRDVDGKVLGVLGSQQGSAPPVYGLEGYLIYPATGTPWLILIDEVMTAYEDAHKGVNPKDRDHFYIEFAVDQTEQGLTFLTGEYTFKKESMQLENSGSLWDNVGYAQKYYRIPVYFRQDGVDDKQAPKLISNGGVFREDIFTRGGIPVVGMIRIS